MNEIVLGHHRVLHFFAEKGFLEKVIELDLVQFPDDEYIHDIVGLRIGHLPNTVSDRNEAEFSLSLKKFLERFDGIVGFYENIREFGVDGAISVDAVELFLVFFSGFEDSEILEIHKLAPDAIDLLVDIATEFPYEDTGRVSRYGMFYEKFLEDFCTTVGPEEFGENHRKR